MTKDLILDRAVLSVEPVMVLENLYSTNKVQGVSMIVSRSSSDYEIVFTLKELEALVKMAKEY